MPQPRLGSKKGRLSCAKYLDVVFEFVAALRQKKKFAHFPQKHSVKPACMLSINNDKMIDFLRILDKNERYPYSTTFFVKNESF